MMKYNLSWRRGIVAASGDTLEQMAQCYYVKVRITEWKRSELQNAEYF
jgi:hypothetical protein